jgi:hypothetical protein
MFNVKTSNGYSIKRDVGGKVNCNGNNFGHTLEDEPNGDVSYCFCSSIVPPIPQVPLSTQGTKIIDSAGDEVFLACTNWYGAHLKWAVVNGLEAMPLDFIAKSIRGLGHNCVRLVYSIEQKVKNPKLNPASVKANPEFGD